MLDAMISSALKKLLAHVHFRKRVSVEEHALGKTTESYQGGKLHTSSMSISEPPEHMKMHMVYQICAIYAYTMTMFRISIQDGIKLYYPQVDFLRK